MLGWSGARFAAPLYLHQVIGAPCSAATQYSHACASCPSCASPASSSAVALVTPVRRLSSTACRFSGTFHYRKVRLTPEDALDPLTKPTNIDKGALHIVSVPIGNLKDFSLRALEVLRGVDYIITTDRPATKTLLDLVNIPNQGRLIHYSRGNCSSSREKLVELLKGGRSMALVTTSGTPCIGDVGAELVQEMQQSDIRVTAVPGASAVMSALAVSGLTTSAYESAKSHKRGTDAAGHDNITLSPQTFEDGSFFFGNVLPKSHGARLRILRTIVAPATFPCVFYEVPRRLVMVLQDIASVLPRRRVYVTHELTKLNESLHAGTAERLVGFYLRQEAQMLVKKGQLVLVIAGAGPKETAAWLEKEAAKRRRLRHTIRDLMKDAPPVALPHRGSATGSSGPNAADSSSGGLSVTTAKEERRQRKQKRAELRRLRQRRKRDRLIRAIESEQERLQVILASNRNDASRMT
ncbi:putative Tetrapyrrole (Corrin/Porphyrin) Methylase [Leishmania shawi]|uniref:Tetrapyrrole (Corrin/Porphyrin) Methylase n=1 Tax=Leishmania shawi TaxID=5680 RepID=A0AAW3B836_9TRYP